MATQRLHNGGFNCIAGQIVILGADWPQKHAFLDALRDAMAAAPAWPPWYPGAADRVESARRLQPAAALRG